MSSLSTRMLHKNFLISVLLLIYFNEYRYVNSKKIETNLNRHEILNRTTEYYTGERIL